MRTSIRLAVPAITASAVMLLGACSSDDSDSEGDGGSGLEQSIGGSGSDESSEENSEESSDSGSEEGTTGGGGEVPSDADVEGGWSNVDQGLGLYVTQGMFSVGNADGSVSCTGTYAGGSLDGQCQDGSAFAGTATLNGDTLNVQLDTGDSYDFTRAGDMDIPEMPEVPDM